MPDRIAAPPSLPRRALARACVAALLLAAPFCAHAQGVPAAPPNIEHFYENPTYSDMLLSPDGKLLAVRVGTAGKRDGLAVIDFQAGKGYAVASFDLADVGTFRWVNNKRLVVTTADRQRAQGDLEYGPGLYAVNADGSGMVQLAEREWGARQGSTKVGARERLGVNTRMLEQSGAQDSEHIYVTEPDISGTSIEIRQLRLLRLNTLTGVSRRVPMPKEAQQWMLDHKGEPRIASVREKDSTVLYYIEPATGAWRELRRFGLFGNDGREVIVPLLFGPDGTLYVRTNNGKDTGAVHTFDLASGKVSAEPIIVTKGYDFDGEIIADQHKVLGLRFTTDAESTIWFDPRMKAVQDAVDKALPATVNIVSVAPRAETAWVLVQAYSDVAPPSFLLFNTDTKVVNKIGDAYPKIDPARSGTQEAVSYKARDGLTIPALLTLPRGKRKDLPLVVLVHGGPFVRGSSWGWQRDSQFLASRGYAVLEPSFRGTTGFGDAHYKAGFKQWGLAMQDDIADGAKWAVAQGIVDPQRICIAGASYGGYATLMGLLRNPDIFKCGVNWVGVTDIELMYTGHWSGVSDFGDTWKDYGMPVMIGDRVKDAAQLKATSPLVHAARITQPLLLAYGGADVRVPDYHGRQFRDAVQKAGNKNVEYVVYQEEGHGWVLPKNSIDFWTRVEKFLDRNIGNKP